MMEKILEALRKGGLVIANRQAGKTIALLTLASELPDSVVIVKSYDDLVQVEKTYSDLFPDALPVTVICGSWEDDVSHARSIGNKILIDDYFANAAGYPFYAATASVGFPVTVINE